jgi:hypothetical protein
MENSLSDLLRRYADMEARSDECSRVMYRAAAEIERLRTALDWYADPKQYTSGAMSPGGHAYLHHVQWDAGKRAGAALSAGAVPK